MLQGCLIIPLYGWESGSSSCSVPSDGTRWSGTSEDSDDWSENCSDPERGILH